MAFSDDDDDDSSNSNDNNNNVKETEKKFSFHLVYVMTRFGANEGTPRKMENQR